MKSRGHASLGVVSVWRHVAAIAYVVAAGVLVARLGPSLEPSTNFGDFYPQRVDYPVFFWALTGAYMGVASRGLGWPLAQTAVHTLALGLLLHVNFLCLAFIGDDATVSRLTVPYFMYYTRAVVALILIVTSAIGFRYAVGALRAVTIPFWLPLAYLPIVNLTIGSPRWAVPVVALGAATALVAPRVTSWVKPRDLWMKGRSILADPKGFAVAVALLALLMRMTAALRLGGMELETILMNSDDATQYDLNARGLLDGSGVMSGEDNAGMSNYSSGYSLFLAMLYGLTGRSVGVVLIIQAVVSSSLPVALYWVGRRCSGELAARVGAVLAALSQLLIFNAVNLTREMLSLLLLVPTIWIFQIATPGGGRVRRKLVFGGVLLGLLILVDPTFIVVAGAFSVVYVLRATSRISARLAPVGVLWLAIFATVIPLKHLVVSPATATFVESLSLVTRGRSYAIHVSRDFNPYAQELYQRGINPFEYPDQSIANVFDDPVENALLASKKIWLDFRRFFFEGNSGGFYPLLLVANSFFSANVVFYAVVFAMIGLATSVSKLRSGDAQWEHGMLLMTMGAYAGTYIVLFFGMTRFRATVHPILILWIGIGVSTVVTWMFANSQLASNPWQKSS